MDDEGIVVFNGMIDNTRSKKNREKCEFKTKSDTEVLKISKHIRCKNLLFGWNVVIRILQF